MVDFFAGMDHTGGKKSGSPPVSYQGNITVGMGGLPLFFHLSEMFTLFLQQQQQNYK
jgi:hypothetical protein